MSVAVPSNVLYVGNLPKGTSKSLLESFLQPYGVMRINVREGYGIAEMNSVAEAQRAIQLLNGQDFNGSSLAVRFKTQPQHKQANQFRQVNNNHSMNLNKDVNGKGFVPLSPPNAISSQDHPQPKQIFQDLSSPQSAGQAQLQPAEVRTVQVGLRGLQITTTNNLAQHQQKQQMQLEQELKNVAFLPDSEKVRQLEQIVHLQQNKINKLEARLEEIMETANKQMHQQQVANRPPNMLIPPPQGSMQLPMQHHQPGLSGTAPPQISQHPQLGSHFTSPHHQFNLQQGQQVPPPQFYGTAQQLAAQQHWGQSTGYPPPTSQFYGGGPEQTGQQQPGYGNVPPPLMLQSKFEPGTFLAPGYPQNVPLTPVDAMNNCFFAPPPPNAGQVGMPIPNGDAFSNRMQPNRIQPNQHHRNDYKHDNASNISNNNRFNIHQGNNNGNRQHVGNFKGQGGQNNRALRGGNNRQGGYQHSNNKNNVDNEKNKKQAAVNNNNNNNNTSPTPVNALPSPNENKAPVEQTTVEQTNKVAESVCPRCLKSIPENASKCPDCRSTSCLANGGEEEAGDENSNKEEGHLLEKPSPVAEVVAGAPLEDK